MRFPDRMLIGVIRTRSSAAARGRFRAALPQPGLDTAIGRKTRMGPFKRRERAVFSKHEGARETQRNSCMGPFFTRNSVLSCEIGAG
jgi:hypothetical protein